MDRTQRSPVNLNKASAEELRDDVRGIGEVLAERILAYRQQQGPFATVGDLVAVAGIGPAWLARFGHQLTVEDAPLETDVGIIPTIETASRLMSPPIDSKAQAHPLTAALEVEIEETAADDPLVAAVEPTAPSGEAAPASAQEAGGSSEPFAPQEDDESRPAAEPEPEMAHATPSAPPVRAPSHAPASAPAGAPEGDGGAAREPRRQRLALGFWRSALLVALGGLLGALVSLGVLAALSGSLNLTPWREYDALNRNVDTMQRNSEIAWARADNTEARVAELEDDVARLQALEGRLGTLEAAFAEIEDAFAGVQSDVRVLEQDVSRITEDLQALGGRVSQAESSLSTLQASVDELQADVVGLQERVGRYDAFVSALRALLDDLQAPVTDTIPEG